MPVYIKSKPNQVLSAGGWIEPLLATSDLFVTPCLLFAEFRFCRGNGMPDVVQVRFACQGVTATPRAALRLTQARWDALKGKVAEIMAGHTSGDVSSQVAERTAERFAALSAAVAARAAAGLPFRTSFEKD